MLSLRRVMYDVRGASGLDGKALKFKRLDRSMKIFPQDAVSLLRKWQQERRVIQASLISRRPRIAAPLDDWSMLTLSLSGSMLEA